MRTVDAKEFKKAMIEADIDSFTQLEEVTGVYKGTASAIVKGDQKPSYDTIVAFADGMHLKYDEIGRIFFANELAQMQKDCKE